MAVTISKKASPGIRNSSKGHTRPRPLTISLDQPGRLRIAHVIALLGISHSSLYLGMQNGRYPKPDGYDGSIPYFNTETIRDFLMAKANQGGGK